MTLALLEYLRPAGRMVLLPYALLIGVWNGYCGLLKGLLSSPRTGVRRAWQKTAASARGTIAGWKTCRSSKDLSIKKTAGDDRVEIA